MSEIVRVLCGQLPKVLKNGKRADPDYYELTVSGAQAGLVHVYPGGEKRYEVTDSVMLQTALEEIEALLAAHPDEEPYPDDVPKCKDVYFRSGTVRYAPREELERILTVLLSPMFREMPRLQGLVAAPVPPAGAVPAMCRIEPESGLASVRSARGSVKYRLRAKGAEIRLDRIENGDVIRLSFPAEMAEPAEKLREILRLPLSAEPGDDPGDREITLQSGEKRYAPAEALFACMEALEETLNADRSGAVGIEYIPVVPQLMGAVVCPTETLRPQPAFPGMIPAAPRPAPAVYPVLNRDGTWDCACGTKGLTSKFCPECGSGKPTAWRCVQCGSENTGRFCTECGARRPEN